MAKVAFSKLNLKKQESVQTLKLNDLEIEVKQYLPVNEKLILISNVINNAASQDATFKNPVKVEIFGSLEIIYNYTNLTFTEKQKEDPGKLYDLLEENGVIAAVVAMIPEDEYQFLIDGIDSSMDAFYNYQNSVMGILDRVSADYSNLDMDASAIQKKIADPANVTLLKNVLEKMG
jgi:hypothetical protein